MAKRAPKRGRVTSKASRTNARLAGKAGVEHLQKDFTHLQPDLLAEPPAAARILLAARGSTVEVDFEPAPGDEDVSGESDSDLGHMIRMKAERGEGVWVFEALDAAAQRRRWLRTIERP